MRPVPHRYVALSLSLVMLTGAFGATVCIGADESTTLYKWVDAQGVTHFSDTPQPGAEKMQVAPAQTFSAASAAGGQSTAPNAPGAGGTYQTCDIAAPTADQSFYAPDVVAVAVRVVPELRDGDHVTVSVDGKELPSPSPDAHSFQITNPDRGAHKAQAVVRDAGGHTLCSSSAVSFFIDRPSLLSPLAPSHNHGSPHK